MSAEKINVLKAVGAEVIVTPTAVPADSPESYYKVAERVTHERNAFRPNQYGNPNNPLSHYQTTGPELWEQTSGRITHFVAGAGTCGSVTGTARYLKEQNPDIQVVAVDPIGSVFYDHWKSGAQAQPHVYAVEGIGEDYLVDAVDFDLIDEMVQVDDAVSFEMTRRRPAASAFSVGTSTVMSL